MFALNTFFKAITFFCLFYFLLIFNTQGASSEDIKEKHSLSEISEVKNKTIGSWWMWASGSGLVVFLIFAFSKEEDAIYNK